MDNEYDGTQRSDRLLDTPFLNGDKNSNFLNNLFHPPPTIRPQCTENTFLLDSNNIQLDNLRTTSMERLCMPPITTSFSCPILCPDQYIHLWPIASFIRTRGILAVLPLPMQCKPEKLQKSVLYNIENEIK
jgi:hypothetical protein